jgi:hypothetical protein
VFHSPVVKVIPGITPVLGEENFFLKIHLEYGKKFSSPKTGVIPGITLTTGLWNTKPQKEVNWLC